MRAAGALPRTFVRLLRSGCAAAALTFACLAGAQNIADGQNIYQTICSACHGVDPLQNVNLIEAAADDPNLIETQLQTNPSMMFLGE